MDEGVVFPLPHNSKDLGGGGGTGMAWRGLMGLLRQHATCCPSSQQLRPSHSASPTTCTLPTVVPANTWCLICTIPTEYLPPTTYHKVQGTSRVCYPPFTQRMLRIHALCLPVERILFHINIPAPTRLSLLYGSSESFPSPPPFQLLPHLSSDRHQSLPCQLSVILFCHILEFWM